MRTVPSDTQATNPLKLNALQARTLAILQALAEDRSHASEPAEDGAVTIQFLPQPHGNHFHAGRYVVLTKDASGLSNEVAWGALERKGLLRSGFPHAAILTAEGLAYNTGVFKKILHGSDH
jgi:hypothetical protein